jgi:nucleoside 2-deoxyribosyltransferase
MLERTARLQAYFAAPLFNEMERNYNTSVVERLEAYISIFLPQRDGGLMMQYIKNGVSPDRAAGLVFEKDLSAMAAADFMIAILDGANVDEGVAFEIGYMFALGKFCIALQTDVRRALPTGNNPMIGSAIRCVFQSVSELVDWTRQFSQEREARESSLTFAARNSVSRSLT